MHVARMVIHALHTHTYIYLRIYGIYAYFCASLCLSLCLSLSFSKVQRSILMQHISHVIERHIHAEREIS